jgi:hypothetical protein
VRRFLKAREKRFRFGVRIGMSMEIFCVRSFFMVVVLRIVDGLHIFSNNF